MAMPISPVCAYTGVAMKTGGGTIWKISSEKRARRKRKRGVLDRETGCNIRLPFSARD
jgi:hypothetical protein